MIRLGVSALAVLTLALPACGDDDSGSAGGSDSQAPTTDQAQTAPEGEEQGTTTSETDAEGGAPDGGHEGESGQPQRPSLAEYIERADRICGAAQDANRPRSEEYVELTKQLARGKVESDEYFRRAGELVEQNGEAAENAVVDLKELPTPASRRNAVEAYLAGATTQAAIFTAQGKALREGRTDEVGRLDRRMAQVREQTQDAARRVGFRVCGGQ